MSVTITVRNVPVAVQDVLANRAARSGRSLQEYLNLELARIAATPQGGEPITRARLIALSYPALSMDEIIEAASTARR